MASTQFHERPTRQSRLDILDQVKIISQKQLREHGVPDFCYLCGEELEGSRLINRDHCPPKGLFAPRDRENFPIILRTHEECNSHWKEADELIGIVTDALHTRDKSQDHAYTRRLRAEAVRIGKDLAASVSNLPLAPMAARIVRGLHALLYKEFLPIDVRSKFHVPLPEVDLGSKRMVLPLPQTFAFSEVIRKSLVSKTADVVRAYNGQFMYACTWTHLDDGRPFCIVAFDIYTFHQLSPSVRDFPKAFIGMYVPGRRPVGAATATSLEFELSRDELLYPLAGFDLSVGAQ